jgi:hypothetical protein
MTRDAHGQHTGILRAFRHAVGSPELPSESETLLRPVRPTEWFGSKITGVDLASDFVWIDDAPLRVEIETLRGLGLLDRLLLVRYRQWSSARRRCDQGRPFRDRGLTARAE